MNESSSPSAHPPFPQEVSHLVANPTEDSGCSRRVPDSPQLRHPGSTLPGPDGGRGQPEHFLRDAHEWRKEVAQTQGRLRRLQGTLVSFCHNYLRGLCSLPAWSSSSSINVRFVLIQPHSPGGLPQGLAVPINLWARWLKPLCSHWSQGEEVPRGPMWTSEQNV